MIAQTIIWRPYPQEKPEKNGLYNVTFSFDDGKVTDILFYENGNWYNNAMHTILTQQIYLDAISAFAELPAPYDPTAPLNFATALLRMKEGKMCRSLSGIGEYIYGIENDELYWVKKDEPIHHPTSIDLHEIEGDWQEVTE